MWRGEILCPFQDPHFQSDLRRREKKFDDLYKKLGSDVSEAKAAKKLMRTLSEQDADPSVIRRAKSKYGSLAGHATKIRRRVAKAAAKIENKARDASIKTAKRLRALGLA